MLLLLGQAPPYLGTHCAEEDVATAELAVRWEGSKEKHGHVYEAICAPHSRPHCHAHARVPGRCDDVVNLKPNPWHVQNLRVGSVDIGGGLDRARVNTEVTMVTIESSMQAAFLQYYV